MDWKGGGVIRGGLLYLHVYSFDSNKYSERQYEVKQIWLSICIADLGNKNKWALPNYLADDNCGVHLCQ